MGYKRIVIYSQCFSKIIRKRRGTDMERKMKLLLAAYIDCVNAQDINCYNIAKYINKEKFEVHAFSYQKTCDIPGVIVHTVSHNSLLRNVKKITVMAINRFDIYYLPKRERIDLLFAKYFKRNTTSSVEIQTVYNNEKSKEFYTKSIRNYFCISKYLNEMNIKNWRKSVPVLYLGIENTTEIKNHKTQIKKIVYIGSVIERKRPDLFVELAERFRTVEFIMIGDGPLLPQIKNDVSERKIKNINFLGKLTNKNVIEKLREYDLLVITSTYEGLPKVVLEAASQAVPTVYVDQNYRIDYIENGITGFGCKTIEEVKERIDELINDNKKYMEMSYESYEMSKKYAWDVLIKDYESFFCSTVYGKTIIHN